MIFYCLQNLDKALLKIKYLVYTVCHPYRDADRQQVAKYLGKGDYWR